MSKISESITNIFKYKKYDKTEAERLYERKVNLYFMIGILAVVSISIIGFVYFMSQPISFEGDIIFSGDMSGDPIIGFLLNNSELNNSSLDEFGSTNLTSINSSIKLHATYNIPLGAFLELKELYLY